MKRTDRQEVIQYARQMGLDVCPPKSGNPGILITDWRSIPSRHIVDARTWKEAKEQLKVWKRSE